MLDDADIQTICERIASGLRRCDELTEALDQTMTGVAATGKRYSIVPDGMLQPIPIEEALAACRLSAPTWAEVDPILADIGRDIATVALMPSATLSGCRAKARVLILSPGFDLAASLAADILMIAQDAVSRTLTFKEMGEVQA